MPILYLVRHGETDWNRQGRWQGHADRPLTGLGRAQAQAVAGVLAAAAPMAIYSSDMERATETAAPLAARTGLLVQPLAGLREIDVGSWSGLTAADVAALGSGRRAPGTWQGGETRDAHSARVVACLRAIVKRHHSEDRLCLFTHGGSILALVAAAFGLDAGVGHRLLSRPVHGGVTTLIATTGPGEAPLLRLRSYNVPAGVGPA